MTKPIDLSAAAAALGRKGGQSTSEAKQAASRANGKRGGRPRKDTTEMLDFEKIAKRVRKDGEKCTASDVERLYNSLDDVNKKDVTEKWLFDSLRNTQPPIND